MELENQGGTGTELNHWEKRLLEVTALFIWPFLYTPPLPHLLWLSQNEAMTGSHTQNRVFSRLTLALLEDSGWYRANYSLAQRLDWGRSLGCDFVLKSCKFWMEQQRRRSEVNACPAAASCWSLLSVCVCVCRHRAVAPYCDTVRASPLQLTCRQDQLAVAVCNLQKFPEQLPPQFQVEPEPPSRTRPSPAHAPVCVCVCARSSTLTEFQMWPTASCPSSVERWRSQISVRSARSSAGT